MKGNAVLQLTAEEQATERRLLAAMRALNREDILWSIDVWSLMIDTRSRQVVAEHLPGAIAALMVLAGVEPVERAMTAEYICPLGWPSTSSIKTFVEFDGRVQECCTLGAVEILAGEDRFPDPTNWPDRADAFHQATGRTYYRNSKHQSLEQRDIVRRYKDAVGLIVHANDYGIARNPDDPTHPWLPHYAEARRIFDAIVAPALEEAATLQPS